MLNIYLLSFRMDCGTKVYYLRHWMPFLFMHSNRNTLINRSIKVQISVKADFYKAFLQRWCFGIKPQSNLLIGESIKVVTFLIITQWETAVRAESGRIYSVSRFLWASGISQPEKWSFCVAGCWCQTRQVLNEWRIINKTAAHASSQ